ncbi:hypothetical protein ABFT80_02545 [Mesorhizobium sp. SB112]|uniref:hypothetical protein n=1 Tax=Mesorhizobium sp. SB112 TaxID=3151853 RepID=UPI003262F8C0
MASGHDDDRERESRRILDRVSKEADSSRMSMVGRTTKRARDHMSATDADQSDRIEYWGTRIGRILGLGFCVVLLIWLVIFVLGR